MTVDWSHFTPWSSLVGGMVIGLATLVLVLGNGRIAGIAGIVGGALQALLEGQGLRKHAVRWLFLAGLIAAPWIWRLFAPLPATRVDVGWLAVVSAGLLVGIGVRMGNGCTSGHGVCGLSRRSSRSLVNVLAFMGAGVVTVTLLRLVF